MVSCNGDTVVGEGSNIVKKNKKKKRKTLEKEGRTESIISHMETWTINNHQVKEGKIKQKKCRPPKGDTSTEPALEMLIQGQTSQETTGKKKKRESLQSGQHMEDKPLLQLNG